MAFFDDIFGMFTGQEKAAPYTPFTPEQQLSRTAELQSTLGPLYNTQANQIANARVGAQDIYFPGLQQLQTGLTGAYQNQLDLGESLSPELRAEITRNLLQTGAATGFGGSSAGLGNIIYQTAGEAQALGRQRRSDASNYANQLPNVLQAYDPAQLGISPGDLSGLAANEANINNQRAAESFYINESNKINKINTFSSMLKGAGAALSGTPYGAALSGIGGALTVRNPYSGRMQSNSAIGGPQYGIGSQSSGGMMGAFGGLFNQLGTQGNYGTGSGGFYGIGANQYDRGADQF